MLSIDQIGVLLQPYLDAPVEEIKMAGGSRPKAGLLLEGRGMVLAGLQRYLDVLLRWNARMNLTAVREPEEIVQRHFGESLFAARLLARCVALGDAVLDFGSGAGFPGLPAALLLPEVKVTLAESQQKKAAFLREAVRMVLPEGRTAEVWYGRVEEMPGSRVFAAVMLRAVDRMEDAERLAAERVAEGGCMVVLHGGEPVDGSVLVPGSERRWVSLRQIVPRGTI